MSDKIKYNIYNIKLNFIIQLQNWNIKIKNLEQWFPTLTKDKFKRFYLPIIYCVK